MKVSAKRLFSIFLVFVIFFTCIQVSSYEEKNTNLYLTLYWNMNKNFVGSNWEYKDSFTPEDIECVNNLLKENGGIEFTLYQNGTKYSSRKIPMIIMEKDGWLCTDQIFFGSYPIYDDIGNKYNYEIKAENVLLGNSPISVSIDLKETSKDNYFSSYLFNFQCDITFKETYDGSQDENSNIYDVTYPYRNINMKIFWENGEPDDIDSVTIPLKGDGFLVENPTITVYKSNYWKAEVTFRYKADCSVESIQMENPTLKGYQFEFNSSSCQCDDRYSPSIDRNFDLMITMRRVGSISITDSYYIKDKDGNLILQKSIPREKLESIKEIELSKEEIGINNIYDNEEYDFFDYEGSFKFELGKDLKLDLKYVKDAKYIPYNVIHEYYVRDKNGEIKLEHTFTETESEIKNYEVKSNNLLKTNYNEITYEFLEDSGTLILSEENDNNITIKYIRNEEYVDYEIIHEYYTKDKNGNLTIEYSENEIKTNINGSEIDSKDILKIIHNNKEYQFLEDSGSLILDKNSLNKIVIKYVRDKEYGSYQVKHEYYVKDRDNNLILENSVSDEIVSDMVNTIIKVNELEQKLENNGKEYSFFECSDDVIIKENETSEIIIKYIRNKEYGSYSVKHNYYVKDKNGNYILEESIIDDLIFVEPDMTIGLKDTDIIISQKLKDDYQLKDATENIIIKANEEIEFIINYFREEKETLKYGSYQVVHEYYLDEKLEGSITDSIISNVLAGTTINVKNADILVNTKLNYNGKSYEFNSSNGIVIQENETNILIIKYKRSEPSIELKPISINLAGIVKLENAILKDKQFSFRMKDEENSYIFENDKNGNIKFNSINFNKEGIYRYIITQENLGEANIKYDTSKYEVEVTISKEQNKFVSSIRYFKNGKEVNSIEFINKYEEPKTIETKPTDKTNENTELVEIKDNKVPQANPNIIKPVETGDNTPITILLILLISSLGGLIVCKKRK